MKKRIFCICISAALIFFVSGCQKQNNGEKSISNIKQSSSKDSNVNNTSDTTTITSNSKENENYSLQKYISQSDKIQLAGKVNSNIDIHMELKKTDKSKFNDLSERYYDSNMSMQGDNVVARYEGTYYYDKYMKNIRVEAQAYANGYVNIFEFNDNNQVSGSFGGFIFQDKILKGMWNNNNIPKYSFYLIKSDVESNGIDLSLDTNRIGSYSRVGSVSKNSTTLVIYSVSDDKIKFHISGYSEPNMGNVGGVAAYTNSSKNTAEFYDKETNLKITFEFDGKSVKVVGNDALSQFAGAHVIMSGTFVK
ncbi:hypothetical protein CFOLD11_47190 [Clostridium folliculivorans]|uniref:Lipoprotein n=1 Tax=Clostridium folliculivorans TaxID=2886038 RepID=A0A9W5Y843_9CLOT|nr:hypothetical protein [Clostridium folliculivorans]GKU27892.1 hypothetical protein CFOLD11_47190 [Clostridium folliculivorans]